VLRGRCLGERADGHEGDALTLTARFACPHLESVGADQGFAAERVCGAMAERGIEAFVLPQRTMRPTDGEPKTDAQRAAQAARERCKTARGLWSHKQRMADAEGVVGELKHRHGLDCVRCRGTASFHLQLLLGCAALNLNRLARHAGEAASGAACAPQTARFVALDADAASAAEGVHWRSIAAPPANRRASPPPHRADLEDPLLAELTPKSLFLDRPPQAERARRRLSTAAPRRRWGVSAGATAVWAKANGRYGPRGGRHRSRLARASPAAPIAWWCAAIVRQRTDRMPHAASRAPVDIGPTTRPRWLAGVRRAVSADRARGARNPGRRRAGRRTVGACPPAAQHYPGAWWPWA
jgi:Transposase DDE domain